MTQKQVGSNVWSFKSRCLLPLGYTWRNGGKPYLDPVLEEEIACKRQMYISTCSFNAG